MAPNAAHAGYDQVADVHGRPISMAFFEEAQGVDDRRPRQAGFRGRRRPHADGGDGAPARALSQLGNIRTLGMAIETAGERSAVGSAGPLTKKGERPLGVRQILPSTAGDYAQAATGAPLDVNRLRNDPAYGRQISDYHLQALTKYYGGGWAGALLATAAYDAGQGSVDNWMARGGLPDPRQGHISAEDWIKRIPVKETRDYAGRVWPVYVASASQGGHR